MNTVLIVEDEQPIRQMVGYALNRAGYKLVEAECAKQAQEFLAKQFPDLILMDWMLPDSNGIELTNHLKRQATTRHIPIIMLTAKTEDADKIQGLNAGADDYVGKPFSMGELIARMQAVWRRTKPSQDKSLIVFQQLVLDPNSHRIFVGDEVLDLGPTEFRLLKFFMQHPERVYSREQLLEQAWKPNIYVEERTVDVHILRLRKILLPFGYDQCIQTVRGAGYRFALI